MLDLKIGDKVKRINSNFGKTYEGNIYTVKQVLNDIEIKIKEDRGEYQYLIANFIFVPSQLEFDF